MQALELNPQDDLRVAQSQWASLAPQRRSEYFRRLRRILSERSSEAASIISAEAGKSPLESLSQEIIPTLDTLLFLEKQAAGILRPRKIRLTTRQFYFYGRACEVRREPYGIVCIFGTWNYSFFISMSQILFALAAGNGVVFKGSELSPAVTEFMKLIFKEAAFPDHLVFAFTGDAHAGEALCRAGCDKYVLTGSRDTGRAVMRSLADYLKPAVMELSGSDSYVIFSDADWKLAVKTLLWAAYQFSGQTCVAPRRVFILKSDREFFTQALEHAWKSCGTFILSQGPLRTKEAAEGWGRAMARLKARGAQLFFGGAMPESGKGGLPAAIYIGLKPEDLEDIDLMAPVFFLFECENTEDMIAQANRSNRGLGASVWTKDRRVAELFTGRLQTGQVWVNDSIFSAALPEAPFGGIKDSGFGRIRGMEGLLEMTRIKFVSFNWRPKKRPRFLPPYAKNAFHMLNRLQKLIYVPGIWPKIKSLFKP